MAVLVDTCVLTPAFNPKASEFDVVRRAIRDLRGKGEILLITPQIVAEYWNVATRPIEVNGRGLTTEQARKMVNVICQMCRLEYETAQSFQKWRELVDRHGVRGVAVHDARLIAVMVSCGIREIFTRNDRDFLRYAAEGITVLTPVAIAGQGR